MPRYIIERDVPIFSQQELEAVAKRSNAVIAEMSDIVWIKSYISAEGKIYCEYDAPNEEAIREHGRRADLVVTTIREVSLEISPAMFQ